MKWTCLSTLSWRKRFLCLTDGCEVTGSSCCISSVWMNVMTTHTHTVHWTKSRFHWMQPIHSLNERLPTPVEMKTRVVLIVRVSSDDNSFTQYSVWNYGIFINEKFMSNQLHTLTLLQHNSCWNVPNILKNCMTSPMIRCCQTGLMLEDRMQLETGWLSFFRRRWSCADRTLNQFVCLHSLLEQEVKARLESWARHSSAGT